MARRLLFAVMLLTAFAVVIAPPAAAACHAFTFQSINPASVGEGGTVTVTVSRDGGVGTSSVMVTSINGTAQAGQDFPAVQRTVTIPAPETAASFTVSTTNDTSPEPAESFKLHLSNGAGCSNTQYSYGPDATITIQDNDAAPVTQPAPATAAPTAAPTTARATTTTVTSTTTTTLVDETTTTGDTTTTTGDLALESAADSDEGSGGGGGTALLGLLAVALVGGVGYVGYTLYRRRQA